MAVWMKLIEKFLLESVYRAGLGQHAEDPACQTCDVRLATGKRNGKGYARMLVRCRSCGEFLECPECCIKRHQQHPTHHIEVR